MSKKKKDYDEKFSIYNDPENDSAMSFREGLEKLARPQNRPVMEEKKTPLEKLNTAREELGFFIRGTMDPEGFIRRLEVFIKTLKEFDEEELSEERDETLENLSSKHSELSFCYITEVTKDGQHIYKYNEGYSVSSFIDSIPNVCKTIDFFLEKAKKKE